MSTLSQFFGSGTNETPGGIKIPAEGVPVHILGVSGAGGGGGVYCTPNSCWLGGYGAAGEGGAGAIFHATNYHVQPGCTVPITIGAGGVPASCPTGAGGQGGDTIFNYPLLPLHVKGGGGGGSCSCCCLTPGPTGGSNWYSQGCPGGNGGGAATWGNIYQQCPNFPGGEGCYYKSKNVTVSSSQYTSGVTASPYPYTPGCPYSYGYGFAVHQSQAQLEQFPWGVKGGFPGNYSRTSPSCNCKNRGYGGKSGGNATYLSGISVGANAVCKDVLATGYHSSISGSGVDYNEPGTFGSIPDSPCTAGVAGGLIISWPTAFGSSPSIPGASDISPQTVGMYTYCFTSSGSITLP